jgi:hypothetical protein
MPAESVYQRNLIKKLEKLFPGCIVLKNDPNRKQGIPDLTILFKNTWAALETKRSKSASRRPNQAHYIDKMKEMAYASFISPENEETVLSELQQTFGLEGSTRVPQSK